MINNKGEVSIGQIIISCIMFLVFLTAALSMTTEFFSYEQNSNGSSYDASYYSSLEDNSVATNSTEARRMVDTTTGMSDDVFITNGSVGDDTPEDLMNKQTLTSMRKLPNLYTFVKNVGRDASEKLGIPSYFLWALVTIVIVIITIGALKALRGIK